jgi:hypothetical protein
MEMYLLHLPIISSFRTFVSSDIKDSSYVISGPRLVGILLQDNV